MAQVDLTTPSPATVHVQPRLAAYVDRTLSEADMDEIEAHLLACDQCFAALVVVSLGRP